MTTLNFFPNILALSDINLKIQKLLRWLQETEAADAVKELESLLQDAVCGDQQARDFLNPYLLTEAITARLPSERREELFQKCREQELKLAIGLFADFLPQKIEPPLATFRVDDVRAEKKERSDPITLGERRSLARSRSPRLLEKLLTDPDERVIANLLNNPLTLQKHVLTICTKRPNRAAVFKTVACHPKWGKNARVRLALIKNPYTPPLLSTLALLTTPINQLKEIVQLEVHPMVSGLAQTLLNLKKKSSQFSRP